MNFAKYITFALLLFQLLVANAQINVGDGAARPAPVAAQTGMQAGKIYVDLKTIVKRRPNFNVDRIFKTCTGTFADCLALNFNNAPNRYGSAFNSGSFRVGCAFSHMAFDDPIFWPGQAGRTHLHSFFGNTSTSAASDMTNMANSGNSTCAGGTLNRTGYWIPTLIYHCPAGSTDGCTRSRDGEVFPPTTGNFYYKCAYAFPCDTGGNGGTPLRWWPVGFRMIGGNPNATTDQDGRVAWRCHDTAGNELYKGGHIPQDNELRTGAIPAGGTYGPCVGVEISISFPICWDGVNIDSPTTHSSHIDTAATYLANFYTGCQGNTAFPVLVPELGLNINAPANPADVKYLRLSSDQPKSSGIPAGVTAHADWVNGDRKSVV